MNSTKEEEKVLETIEQFNRAFAANDTEKYFQFIDDAFTLFIPSSPYRIDGKIPDKEEFEFSLKLGRTKVGFFQQLQTKIQLFENLAVVTYYSRGGYGSDNAIYYLKETDVLVKKGDKWKIIHIHVSSAK